MKKQTIAASAILASVLLSACSTPTYVEQQRNITNKDYKNESFSCANLLQPKLRSDAPQNYIVKRGDTLWGIASRYLHNPWAWKGLWQANPQIKNPHRIYPGDELVLEGNSIRVANRASGKRGGLAREKLSPQVQNTSLDLGIPTIEARAVESFLSKTQIINPQDLQFMPYILDLESSTLMSNVEKRLYVQGSVIAANEYDTYRKGSIFTDPFTKKVIGQEMIKTGSVVIERAETNHPSSAFVKTLGDIPLVKGDYLIKSYNDKGIPNLHFDPTPAPQGTEAQILGAPEAFSNVGVGQTVILSKGLNAGLQPGSVLLAQTTRSFTTDPVTNQRVALPAEARGTLMVYKVFDETSLAIVTQAQEPIRIGSWATAPNVGCHD